jgi:hypothetical protein
MAAVAKQQLKNECNNNKKSLQQRYNSDVVSVPNRQPKKVKRDVKVRLHAFLTSGFYVDK